MRFNGSRIELDLAIHRMQIIFFFFLVTKNPSCILGSDQLPNTKHTIGSNENCQRRSEAGHLDQQSDEHIRQNRFVERYDDLNAFRPIDKIPLTSQRN